ncbi:MAG: hypothetical protein WDM78_21655 [Puia sp.]
MAGSPDGFSKGKRKEFSFWISRISYLRNDLTTLGPQLALADGVALAHT